MAESVVSQTSFNTGQLSPFLSAGTDLKVYARGGELVDNYLPTVEGPLTRRPGTAFLVPQADETHEAVMIPFIFSATQRYQLEFGHSVLRVFRDQELILSSAYAPVTVQTITPANPLEMLLTTTVGLTTGDSVYVSGTACPEINNQFFRVTVVSAFNITLDGVDGLTFTAQAIAQGTVEKVYSVFSPYTSDQAQRIRFVQNGDVLYLASSGVPRFKLSRLADDNWTFTAITGAAIDTADEGLASWPPFAVANTTTTALYVSAVAPGPAPGVAVDIIASVGTPFVPGDVGRFIKLAPRSAEMGYALVTAYVSATQVTVTVYSRFPNNAGPFSVSVLGAAKATTQWAWSAFDATNGYPKAVGLHDGRLVWTGNTLDPTLVQLSVVDSYENHRPYDADPAASNKFAITQTMGFFFRTRSETQDGIEWLASLEVLFFGTESGEWTLRTTDPLTALSPSNFEVRKRGRAGSRADVLPIVVDSVVLFVQRAGRKLKEFIFRSDQQVYESPDMTQLSRWVTLGRIKRMAYQQEPNRVIWIVTEAGELLSFTYERNAEVTAWAQHTIEGGGLVESVSVTPSYTQDEDEVWVTVQRTIDGQTRRYVEVLQRFWDPNEALEQAVFCDSAVSYSGVPVTKLYGLLHLVGETVKVLADGAPIVDQVVDSDGAVTLPEAASDVVIGKKIVSRFKSMRPEFGGSALKSGTAQGYRKRVRRLALRLVECGQGLFVGPSFDDMKEVQLRKPGDSMDATPPLFTGDTGYRAYPGGFDLDGQVHLKFEEPLPCTIAAYYAKMQSEENE